jgi:chromosome segregation ATPase
MKLTLKEAADAVGRDKSTLFRAIKAGTLKSMMNDSGMIFIELDDLMAHYPLEDSDTRMNTKKRGRPTGSRKNNPESVQSVDTGLSKEIIRLEELNKDYRHQIEFLNAKLKADELRVADLMVDRERLGGRVQHLEQDIDVLRHENAVQKATIYSLNTQKDTLDKRLMALEDSINQMVSNQPDNTKKTILQKLFA